MNKIINGKKYDTNTAEALGVIVRGGKPGDIAYEREVLYRKKTGEFFLYGEGGPYSSYASICGDDSSSGEQIRLLTEKEAREWAEEALSGDEYEEIFGEVEE